MTDDGLIFVVIGALAIIALVFVAGVILFPDKHDYTKVAILP